MLEFKIPRFWALATGATKDPRTTPLDSHEAPVSFCMAGSPLAMFLSIEPEPPYLRQCHNSTQLRPKIVMPLPESQFNLLFVVYCRCLLFFLLTWADFERESASNRLKMTMRIFFDAVLSSALSNRRHGRTAPVTPPIDAGHGAGAIRSVIEGGLIAV